MRKMCYDIKGDVFMSLCDGITCLEVNKIFDNRMRKVEYLEQYSEEVELQLTIPHTLSGIDQMIVNTWDYMISKRVIREMFFNSEKFLYGVDCKGKIDFLIKDWHQKRLGEMEWPFAAMNFDNHIARINRMDNYTEEEKDNITALDVIRFRRIKDLNACRNDYIESLIVYHNENIIPTFKHNRGLDFYINGEPFDQKVSRSVGRAFIDYYGEDYYNTAINRPDLVAASLYENQDEERFDDDPRLYVVYLDTDISSEAIARSIIETNLEEPLEVEFDYIHSNHETIHHRAYCYVLLLHN